MEETVAMNINFHLLFKDVFLFKYIVIWYNIISPYLKKKNPNNCWCCSVTKSCLTLWDLVDCSRPGSFVLNYLPEFAQTHVHWVDDAI